MNDLQSNQACDVDDLIQKVPPIKLDLDVVESLEELCATRSPRDGKVYIVYYSEFLTGPSRLVIGYKSKWIDLETGWFVQPSDLSRDNTKPKYAKKPSIRSLLKSLIDRLKYLFK